MAEHGAHITSAAVADRPTIFEVLAQESLMSTVRPAVKHAVRILAESRPERCGWVLRYYDEIYTLLDFTVQNYYLQKYGGSFAENFYDLKRVPADDTSLTWLSRRLQWKSLFFLVFLPYIKNKLDQKFEDLRYASGPNASGISQYHPAVRKFYKLFLAVYPYIHMTWEGTCLWYQMTYMFGRGRWHSPFLKLSGAELRRLGEDDMENFDADLLWQNASVSQKFCLALRKTLSMAAVMISSGLSVGMFFLQFLEWWYASDSSAPSLTALPVPDAPQCQTSQAQCSSLICPVCNRTRTNDTALSVSGYVFCYPCIHGYVQQYGCCPVTGYPALMDHMIKLYPPDS